MPMDLKTARDNARAYFLKRNLILTLVVFLFVGGACGRADGEPVYVTPAGIASPTPFQPQSGVYESPFEQQPTPSISVETDSNDVPLEVSLSPTPTSTVPDFPVLNLSVDINPLTGLPPSDPVLLERRPLAIKISNFPREIRPQFGLTRTDQVFEYYIEWGDTRFIGIFYGEDASQVGPVRSGRYFDEHIARMYHAFYIFNFADRRELDYFKGSDLVSFLVTPSCEECTCPPFFVSNPNKLADESHLAKYFDTTRASACFTKKGVNNSRQPIRNGFFSELIPQSEYSVNRIYTLFSSRDYHYWQYDPESQKYFRFQEVSDLTSISPEAYAPLLDAGTNQQVSAENVIILFVRHIFANNFDAEDEVYKIDLVDSGKAVVFRDGIAIPAKWWRAAADQPLFLTTPYGSPIFLRPGRTFYEVLGASSTSYQDESGWHYQFITP